MTEALNTLEAGQAAHVVEVHTHTLSLRSDGHSWQSSRWPFMLWNANPHFCYIFFVVKGMGSCKPKSQSVEHWHFVRWSLLQSHHGARDRVVQICSETSMLSSTSLIVRKPNCCCYQPYSSIADHHRMAPINAAKPTFRTTTIKFSQYCRILPHVLRTHQSN